MSGFTKYITTNEICERLEIGDAEMLRSYDKDVVTPRSRPLGPRRPACSSPFGRVGRFLKAGKYAQRVGAGAPVYLASVLEYLTAEVLELAGI